jgi:hypothetical protein
MHKYKQTPNITIKTKSTYSSMLYLEMCAPIFEFDLNAPAEDSCEEAYLHGGVRTHENIQHAHSTKLRVYIPTAYPPLTLLPSNDSAFALEP